MSATRDRVFCAGVALETADGDMADALRRLIALREQGTTFRVQNRAPWVLEQPGTGHIECMTSGSSGQPKVIRRSFASWRDGFDVNRRLFGLGPEDCVAVFGTLGHSLALYGVMEGLHAGAGVEFLAGLRPDHQAARLRAARASVLYATPTQIRVLMDGQAFPDVRLILCGGGALDKETLARARSAFANALFREFYGASETSFITMSDDATPEGSVGRAYPGVEIEIRKPHDGVGEVWVKSPYLFEGYAQGESAETRRQGAFLTVGELGRCDEAGNLWLAGRRSRMVTIADRNVYPEEIEKVLADALSGRSCAVVAFDDPLRGHRLCAFIEGAEDSELERHLRQVVREKLGREMVPRRFRFLTPFPALPTGKPDLRELMRMGNADQATGKVEGHGI
ncbi:AMP-binding protein [Breoghania sp.]|uniref:class I adenylate-forming enzyme family protein n=1 Tax=Breoghania sp. TaxID=2065378 RepID=UPI002AA85BB0|nr:AMP-binding protein [Breoghania sp.]